MVTGLLRKSPFLRVGLQAWCVRQSGMKKRGALSESVTRVVIGKLGAPCRDGRLIWSATNRGHGHERSIRV